jgi:pyruvate kinase
MQASHLLLEEPIRLASILESSTPNPFSSMTKIIGTLGPKSRDVETISKLLNAGMSVARFDFSWGDEEYHQGTLDNLKIAVKNTRRLCAVIFDTVGPELQIVNEWEHPIALEAGGFVTLTPDLSKEPSPTLLPINWPQMADAVKPKDTIFVGQYLFTGSESTSVWLQVVEVQNMDVKCEVKNSATLTGGLFTAHATQVPVNLPTLSEADKKTIATWGVRNSIDFLSLSFTRNADDVRQARAHMSTLGDLYQTQIFAKIESVEGLRNFDEILKEADGIMLCRGDLGIDLPPEKVIP